MEENLKEVFKMYTTHSVERVMERGDRSLKEAIVDINRAWYEGSRGEEFGGREREYLEGRTSDRIYPIVFRRNVYLFDNDGNCVTMYPVPKWFGRELKQKAVKPRKLDIRRYLMEYDEGEFAWEVMTAGRLGMA